MSISFWIAGAVATAAPLSETAIVDAHMHQLPPQGMAEFELAMQELGVERALLIGTPTQWAKTPSSRYIPSLMFPCETGLAPNVGFKCFPDGSEFPPVEQVRSWIKEGRISALGEINAQYMGVAPNDPRLEPYYTLAEELDVPVGIHLGIGPPGAAYQRPGFPPRKSTKYRFAAGNVLALEDVLIRHPKLRVYVMHAAWPMRGEMIYMLYMHPQLHVDVAVLQWAIPRPAYYAFLKDLVDAGFSQRIMFGSDGGAKHLREGVAAIREAPFLSETQKRAILRDNAARFFKLEGSAPAKPTSRTSPAL